MANESPRIGPVSPGRAPASGDLDTVAGELKGLAHVHRLHILQLLTRPRYAEEIADALGMTRPSALKHVERLQAQDFIRAYRGRRASGPVVEYLVHPQRLFAVSLRLENLARIRPEGGPTRVDDEPTLVQGNGRAAIAREAPRTAGVRLLVADGPRAGATLALADGTRWTIGRESDRSLALPQDPFVSTRHAEIRETANGFDIIDVHSANGTYVNLQLIPRGARVPLHVGDVIGVGGTHLVLQGSG